MIILEGCDGSGKTTLAKKLSEDLGLNIGQRGTTNRDDLWRVTKSDTWRALGTELNGPALLWDRLYFSEHIYSLVQGRDNQFNGTEQRTIETILKVLRIPIIVCSPPFPMVQEAADEVHQMEGVMESLRGIYRAYEKILASNNQGNHVFLNMHRYDYTQNPYEWVRKIVTRHLDRRKDRECSSFLTHANSDSPPNQTALHF